MNSMAFSALYDGLRHEGIAGGGEQIAQVLRGGGMSCSV